MVVLSAVFASSAQADGFVSGEDGTLLQDTQPTRLPIIGQLEALAESYWADRGVTVPTPVEVFIVPPESDGGIDIGYGDEPGRRVWLTEPLLVATHGPQYQDGRAELCKVFLHERGHNAGLSHTSPFPIMYESAFILPPPRCMTFASRPAFSRSS